MLKKHRSWGSRFASLTVQSLGFGAIALYAANAGQAASPPPTNLYAALGDSITAGTFAETRIASWNATAKAPFDFSSPEALAAYFNLGARAPQMGSKELYYRIENKGTLSWASGQQISSQFMRLGQHLKQSGDKAGLTVMNVAVPAERAASMESQAQLIVNAMKTGKYKALKYVTLLVGANDTCSYESDVGTPNDKMAVQLGKAFAKLAEIEQAEPIRILVSSLPPIPDLGETRFLTARTLLHLSCREFRDHVLRFCNPMTVWSTPQEYQDHVKIVEDKNEVLRQAALTAQRTFANLDVRYTDNLYHTGLDPALLAGDCFHPNEDGQSLLSEKMWSEQPWF